MAVSSARRKAILVTGATGKQGGATVEALIQANATSSHQVLALTRNRESSSAKRLEVAGVKIVQGDLNDVPAVFREAKKAIGGFEPHIWGVFSVQTFMGKGASIELEELQGKALVDGALANGVQHFVYASVDRGGAESYEHPTSVPHFRSKHNIEHHLVEKSKGKMSWTILRPVFFMDNIASDFGSKAAATFWKIGLKTKPLQLVAVKDIGWFAAQSFLRPAEFASRGISIAGDSLSHKEANEIFRRKAGRDLPGIPNLLGRLLLGVAGDFGKMFNWFSEEGYGADVAALKMEHPELLTWSNWLDDEGRRLVVQQP
ncbi:NmrA-like family domain-containing protein 1 [Colletotrichum tropicale]|nr:NmrA-like family domain-containing protein 1 [Colletotrichum tropicale]